jgi:hypothetical protein
MRSRRNQLSDTQQRPARVPGGAAGAPTPNAPNGEQQKAKRHRSSPFARPAYIVVQVMDESGQPCDFDKKRIKVLAVERSSDEVLRLTEEGDHPHSFYLRVIVPATNKPVARPAA